MRSPSGKPGSRGRYVRRWKDTRPVGVTSAGITNIGDGTRARIVPHGEIDYDTLLALRAATAALAHVTDLLWDIRETTFMDVVGLHLLFDPSEPAASVRTTRVTGLGSQPTGLLTLVSGLNSSARLQLDRVTRL
ncbi:hypothetical protein ACIRNU_33435 [Streptomyces rochei]|uniref:hypothetical protein n=1 Tax=Streptomyces rochei TaxID=1928 RepID=UPI0037FDD1EA